MRKRRAAKLAEEQVDGVSVDAGDANGDVTVRLDDDETWVATISDAESADDSASDPPEIRPEYVTDGATRAERKAARLTRRLSRRAR